MGLFDWLFGKKSRSGRATLAPPSSPTRFSVHPLGNVESLLQRSKELAPNDLSGAGTLLGEMLQTAVQSGDATAGLVDLNLALDSMVRHYPEAVRQQALENPLPAARERAVRLLLERRDLRGLNPGIRIVSNGWPGTLGPLLRELVRERPAQIAEEDLTALVQLQGQEKQELVELGRLADQEIQRRQAKEEARPGRPSAENQQRQQPGQAQPAGPAEQEEANLRRWCLQVGPAWVDLWEGRWSQQDWLDLLALLRRTDFWPLNPDALQRAVEELKQEYFAARR